MKRVFSTLLAAICLLLAAASTASAEKGKFMFGVKPGMLIQTSYFGLSYSRLEPFVGLDWVAVSVNSDDGDVAGSVFIPHFGSKWYLKAKGTEHAILPYFLGDVFFSLASVTVDGAAAEEEDAIKEFLEFWGMTLGFGMEYYFSDKFSVGGEWGLRLLYDKVSEHSKEEHWGDYTYKEKVNDEFTVAFRVTYAAISLNYRF